MTEGKPDPPRNLSITGCTESTVGLKWEPPELDGGSPITGYVVEMRPTSKKTWTKVDDTKMLELTASKLTASTEYLFRVAAQNAVGVGEFVELQKPAVPKGEFGELKKRLSCSQSLASITHSSESNWRCRFGEYISPYSFFNFCFICMFFSELIYPAYYTILYYTILYYSNLYSAESPCESEALRTGNS